MKYYLIAGEASGDLHGSNLMKALKVEDPQAEFRIWGGDLMQAAGGDLRKHYRDLAFMGFVEVLKNLRTILRNLRFCQEDILAYQPDALILIDYPGFNLRIAKWAKQQGIKVLYYISPQIWAWHTSRVHQIKANVDRMYVILPFEKEFYAKYDCAVDFVGHPLLDVVKGYTAAPDFRSKNGLDERPIIALLPGSRKQEITRMLSVMLEMAPLFPAHQFVIAGAPSMPAAFYEVILAEKNRPENVRLVQKQTYDLLSQAAAALVTSGTATLETALFQVPEVVCYRGGNISYQIAKRLVNVKYISLVNLIVDKPLVTELIQDNFNSKTLHTELEKLFSPDIRSEISAGFAELQTLMGDAGASRRAARMMIEKISN
ncbi:lipid-A-disaccharide synthase [Haliscomenobacter hydrossis]|uniref:Lipid-A-disaccharide synthase n=1 Tax=Haliscomenobacter hydrossis (strain ATCC 27775 / DSM 1100 / LMG 10767 / O) TaxID=760192 RepID=F4L2D7_HALH1|nr:lipid-A-disaccharide synthase [Haliscomenobacter hydrossis]AEE52890.1 lipid-A-disaccharide synthase [Haliscomenobacter hydrossis DSM 1100]